MAARVDAAVRHAIQVPVNDPLLLVPAMAQVTEHLGFGVTCTLSYEPPYTFARRMSTLDHLTKGRIGWNIVTGYLDSAAKGAGLKGQSAHDRRYDIAEEYMEVVYKLWEGSWEDDAVLRDRGRGIFARAGEGPSHRPSRRELPRRRDPPVRAVAAAHARAVSGRRLRPRPRIRRPPRRMRVHVGALQAGRGAARRRHPRPRRRGSGAIPGRS